MIVPIKCKLCDKLINPPEDVPVIGQAQVTHAQQTVAKLLAHMKKRVEAEAKMGSGPHLEAMRYAAHQANTAAGLINGALLVANFELPEQIDKDRIAALQPVHELTRTVRMSDDDLAGMIEGIEGMVSLTIMNYLCDLRDRYESLGKYAPPAPPQPETSEPKPELVKP